MLETTLDAFTALAMTQGFYAGVEPEGDQYLQELAGLIGFGFPESEVEEQAQAMQRAAAVITGSGGSMKDAVLAAAPLLEGLSEKERLQLFVALLGLWPTADEHREPGGGLHLVGLGFGFEPERSDSILASLESLKSEPGPGRSEPRRDSAAPGAESNGQERARRSSGAPDPGLVALQPESPESSCRVALLAYPSIGLGLAAARVPIIRQVVVKNESTEPLVGAVIRGRVMAPQFEEPLLEFEAGLPTIEGGERRILQGPSTTLEHNLLLRVDSSVPARVEVDIVTGSVVDEHRDSNALRILAHNQWAGFEQSAPDSGGELLLTLLACHVQPQDPAVERIRLRASELLASRTGNSAQEGYQSGPERVIEIARANFDALVGLDINYSDPPASSEEFQCIRTAGQVVDTRFGTCLDTACLLSACLEQAGLSPFLVIITGHAFVAVWLEEGRSLPQPLEQDEARFQSLVDANQLLLIETTAVTQGHSRDFKAAVEEGRKRLITGSLLGAIDIRVARRSGLIPIPTRTVNESGEVQVIEYRADSGGGVTIGGERVVAAAVEDKGPVPARILRWQSELLDLSLRNPLLNLRLGSRSAGLGLVTPPDAAPLLEEILARGHEIVLCAHDTLSELQRQRGARLAGDIAEEDLRACLKEAHVFVEVEESRLVQGLKKLRNKARAVEEESGANILHLTLGTVVWTDPDKKREVRSPFLIVPIRLKTGGRGRPPRMAIDRTGEGAVINHCLMEKLRQVFRLSVPGLSSWSVSSEGGGIDAAYQMFREAVVRDGLSIELEPSCALALLNFGKFRMWRDLRDHWQDFMETSPFVAHMIERPGESFEQEQAHPTKDEIETAEAFCPVPYDGSQLEAIVAAAHGCSFVLEGPPGTGKSQTITNLVAHALAEGRRVLFVAEKRAALDVVKGRLQKVGLGPFCLDIHDKKSTPKSLREQLLASLNFHAQSDPGAYEEVRGAMGTLADELRGYSDGLHEVNEAGHSLWSSHQVCLASSAGSVVELPADLVASAGSRLSEVDDLCTELVADARAAGLDEGAPWMLAGIKSVDGLTESIASALARVRPASRALSASGDSVRALLGTAGPGAARALELVSLARSAGNDLGLTGAADRDSAEAMVKLADELDSLRVRSQAFELLEQGVGLDKAIPALQALEEARAAFFLFRRGRLAKALASARAATYLEHRDATAMEKALRAAVADLKLIARLTRRLEEFGAKLSGSLRSASEIRRYAASLRWSGLRTLESPEVIELAEGLADQPEESLETLEEFQSAWADFRKALSADEEGIRRWCGSTELLVRVEECLADWERDAQEGRFLMLGRWARVVAGLDSLRALGLGALADGILGGAVAVDELPATAKAAIARACRSERLRSKGLLRFDGERHTRKTAEFSELIGREAELLLEELPTRLLGTRPFKAGRLTGTIAELHRVELKRKRGGRGIRALLRDYSEAVAALTPCVLAGPDSVAQYLEPGSMEFDLVVFDEASQVTVSNAVGAMGRGRSIVVVGDSRQMPPTSFFSRGAAADEVDDRGTSGEGEFVPEDLESILEECVSSGLRSVSLSWHYRSEDESLIAFSNEHYYEDRLSSFPAPGGRAVSLGVTWRKVEGGQFLTGAERTNPKEADAIVAEIRERLRDPVERGRSVGVVALNLQQADLIRDRLEAAAAEDVELARRLEDESESGIFIKNLENVQGDERDVIMISVTYAPNPGGSMRMQFGPLGQAGGERRWNVLVTRAKQEVVVFSSIEPEDIKLERVSATAKGVHHMRSYLELARDGVERARERALRPMEAADLHRKSIADALRGEGLLVQESVGLSSFKIDLAIGHPEEPDRWLAAVLLDGPGYQVRATVRDRDALPRQVLGALMRWPTVMRVWLPEWLAEPAKVTADLVRALDDARVHARASKEKADLVHMIVSAQDGDWRSTAPLPEEIPRPGTTGGAAAAWVQNALQEREAVRCCVLDGDSGGADTEPVPEPVAVERDPRELDFRPFEPRQVVGTSEELKSPLSGPVAARVDAAIKEVLEAEGPIEEQRLAKFVANLFGIQRVRAERIEVVLGRVSGKARRATDLGSFLWPEGLSPESWRGFRRQERGQSGARSVEEIAPEEIRNALLYLVETGVGISRSDAVAELAEAFGIKRVSKGIRARLEAVIDLAVGEGSCTEDAGRLSIRS